MNAINGETDLASRRCGGHTVAVLRRIAELLRIFEHTRTAWFRATARKGEGCGADDSASQACRFGYLIATMMKSTGLPPAFFASCGTPRPTNCASPRAQVVFAGLPSTAKDICAAPNEMTT